MTKGMELSLNTIILISIAVVVIVSIFALFGNQFISGGKNTETQRLLARGCNTLVTIHGCDAAKISEIKLDNTNLNAVCAQNSYTAEQCAAACGCGGNYEDFDV